MSTTITDAQLVTSFLAGDRGALAAIYDRYAASLYDTAAAMLSDRHDAADMVQDVFCVAVERLGQLRDPERLKPWLFAVLRNEVYRRTRKRRRATPTDFSAEGVSDVVAPREPAAEGESVEYEELASLVRSAAAGLDERDQLVLELSVRQGLTGADLADALGVSPEQSYSMVHRMRERVDKSIGAFIVARTGRRDCPTLAEILRGWDGEFNVLVRKRVARHVDSCSVCERKRGAVAPLALFAAAPAFILPIGLREQVLAAATPLPGSTMPAHSARRIRFNRHDGFPRAARFARHAVAWGAGATAAIVVGAAVVVVAGRDDSESGSPIADPLVVVTEAPDDTTDSSVVTIDSSVVTIVDGAQDEIQDDTQNDDIVSSTTPLTTPVTVRPSTPVTNAPITTAPATTPAPATTKAPTPTNAPATNAPATTTPSTPTPTSPAPTTTVARYNGAYLTANAKSVLFGTAGTTGSVTLTNPSPRPITWTVAAPTTASTFFTFSPASGTLEAGKTVKVSITFARSSAADYANTSTFPETSNFSHTANFSATGADGGSTAVSLALTGKVTRSPLVRQASISFSGSGNACVNAAVTVRSVDESGVKSVVGTATLVNNDGTTASRSLVFTNQGDKIGWTAPVNDLATRTVEVTIAVSVIDNLGLSTPVNMAQKRPATC